MSFRTLGRDLLRSPGFTAATVVTLALGIGANTAVFSVIEAALLRPLPYSDPQRLVSLRAVSRGVPSGSVAIPEFLTWRARTRTLAAIAGYTTREFNLTGVAIPERLAGVQVTTDLLPLLGVQPAQGRGFLAEEALPGARPVAILSHAMALRLGIAAAAITLDGVRYDVAGVLPAGFRFPDDTPIDLLTPLPLPDAPDWGAGGFRMIAVLGRLRPGSTPAMVRSELEAVSREVTAIVNRMFPTVRDGFHIRAVTLREQLSGNVPGLLFVLTGAVAFVLLIACVNVAHLSLARSRARRKEFGVRQALGATRARLVRHILAECLALSLLGAAAGLVAAGAVLRIVRALAPPAMPYLQRTALNPAILAFTLALAMAAVLLFGLAPAFSSARLDLNEVLKETGAAPRRRRFRFLLVAAEVALALVLLIGAGLLLRSYAGLRSVDPGFRPDHVLTLRIRLPREEFADRWRYAAFLRRLEDRLSDVAGVRSAGAATSLPLSGLSRRASVTVTEGGVRPAGGQPIILEHGPGDSGNIPINSVTSGYFRTMSIPLLTGRPFDLRDTADAPRVAIVNRSFARRFFPTTDPLIESVAGARIVGIVADARDLSLWRDAVPEVFMPFDQSPLAEFAVVLKTAGNPLAAADAVRAATAGVDRNQAVYDIASMDARLAESVVVQRFQTSALTVFAALALSLAALGAYSVVAYSTAHRTHEMGIRMALGATAASVFWLVVRQAMAAVFAGIALGAAGSLALARLLAGYLYRIEATDTATFAAASLAVAAVAFAAVCASARRAGSVSVPRAL